MGIVLSLPPFAVLMGRYLVCRFAFKVPLFLKGDNRGLLSCCEYSRTPLTPLWQRGETKGQLYYYNKSFKILLLDKKPNLVNPQGGNVCKQFPDGKL